MPAIRMDLKGQADPMQSSAMRWTDFLSGDLRAAREAIKLQRAWRSFSHSQGSTRSVAAAFVASGVTCVGMAAEEQPPVPDAANAGLVAPADAGTAPFAVMGISTVVLDAAAAPPCRVRVGPVPPAKATALSLNPRSSNKPLMEAFDAFADAMADPATIKAAQASYRWKHKKKKTELLGFALLCVSAQSLYTVRGGRTNMNFTPTYRLCCAAWRHGSWPEASTCRAASSSVSCSPPGPLLASREEPAPGRGMPPPPAEPGPLAARPPRRARTRPLPLPSQQQRLCMTVGTPPASSSRL